VTNYDLKKLGIDEIAIRKGQGNYYAVLVNIDTGKIIGLVEKRTEEALTEYLKCWGEKVLSQIEEVSIDLWIGYKNVAEKLIPKAQIVGDRFPVMKQVILNPFLLG
jgi:transposase